VLLLERTAKSVSLTQAAARFMPEACAVLQRADQAKKKAQAVPAQDTELHIGYRPRLAPGVLVIMGISARDAATRAVRFNDWRNDENMAGLRQGRLHLAIGFPNTEKICNREPALRSLTQESARWRYRRNTVYPP